MPAIPHSPDKTAFQARLPQGEKPEPPVSNGDFLVSLLQYGLWLRSFAARDHLLSARQEKSGIHRMSSAVGLHTQLGAHSEDIETLVVAFAAWESNRELLMADILSRVNLVSDPDNKKNRIDGKDSFTRKLRDLAIRDVRIDRSSCLAYLASLGNEELLSTLGVPWQARFPSTFAPTFAQKAYAVLPTALGDLLKRRTDEARGKLRHLYNKIKHGPQVYVANPRERGGCRGLTMGGVSMGDLALGFNEPLVRLLLDGARTQETDEEIRAMKAMAPFLIHSQTTLDRIVYNTMVHEATLMMAIVRILLAYVLKLRPVPDVPAEVVALVAEQWSHNNPEAI